MDGRSPGLSDIRFNVEGEYLITAHMLCVTLAVFNSGCSREIDFRNQSEFGDPPPVKSRRNVKDIGFDSLASVRIKSEVHGRAPNRFTCQALGQA
jgi:hypothetical protein